MNYFTYSSQKIIWTSELLESHFTDGESEAQRVRKELRGTTCFITNVEPLYFVSLSLGICTLTSLEGSWIILTSLREASIKKADKQPHFLENENNQFV